MTVTGSDAQPASSAREPLTSLLRELFAFLGHDNLSVADVARHLGQAPREQSDPLPVQPRDAGVRAAKVFAYPDTGLPYLIELEPADDAQLTPAQLRSTFGDYTRQLTHFGAPRELLFTGLADTEPWRVVILVEVEPTGDVENGRVTRITFRRDPP
jgi:hypothetical protein